MALEFVDADPRNGFHFSYFLYTPASVQDRESVPILVESTNVDRPTDDFEAIRSEAERRASRGFSRRVADELSVPFLHPVFARPWTEPVDWTHYTHSLDRETLLIEDNPLERIDLQLLKMFEDARERLANDGIATENQFLMNGFSASGTFANRFTALHPKRVIAVTAGGLNGMAILPLKEIDIPIVDANEWAVNYPVGVADIQELTGEPFDLDAFLEVPQFLYIGEDDDKDTLLYPDAWTGPDLRLTAVFVYGDDIHRDRFPKCRSIYDEMGVSAVFRTYENAGHEPVPAFDDIIAFHERCIAGEDIDVIRADLGGNASA